METDNTPPREWQLVPTLSVRNAPAAIDFYCKAFGATIRSRHEDDDGDTVAELLLHGVMIVVADEAPEFDNSGPEMLGGTPVRLGLNVPDPDAVYAQAVAAGATAIYPVEDQSYGYRLGRLVDPYGHHWEILKPL